MIISRVPVNRRIRSRIIRPNAAQLAFTRPHPPHNNNDEEIDYPFVANYSKGLPHNPLGEVDPVAYAALQTAVTTGDPADFDAIPLAGPSTRHLTNPQAGMAYDLEGPDAQAETMPPAPRIDSAENSAEMGELYWMALLRDVNFT